MVSISQEGVKLIEPRSRRSSEAIYAAITRRYGARKLAELQEMLRRVGKQSCSQLEVAGDGNAEADE